jgi:adenylyltransferase/sulfurtransferase
VPGLGTEGQQKLAAAKVLIIGAGGLGTPAAVYLAAAGAGTIGILDGDTVSLSNLSRQFYYTENEIGGFKALQLSEKLQVQNPAIQIIPVVEMLTKENAVKYISSYDIICDCTDNAEARGLIDETCGKLNKPLVYAAVKEWEGYITVLHHTRQVSLNDIFSYSTITGTDMAGCAMTGIINTTCSMAGTLQATETLKVILGINSSLDGGILCFNIRVPLFRIFALNKPWK